ncbi:MAG: YggT family protein [Roseitalea sp.]|nr:YggT family protein [Roseitalea sp.]MBO6721595.1 YggT family protein [Roseitalea sp.]MBO6743351.1 YggT family protein [Roseitalea sp.]
MRARACRSVLVRLCEGVPAKRRTSVGLTIINTLLFALNIYTWIVIGAVIFSWLYAFNVVNSSNRFVSMLGEFFYKATEPLLRPIRRVLPDLGGIDISPIVLFVGIYFVGQIVRNVLAPAII